MSLRRTAFVLSGLLLLTLPLRALANRPPVIEFLGDRTVRAIETLFVSVGATDDGPPVPWLRAETLPRGARFEDAGDGTRFLLWTPSANQVGTHAVRFIAADAADPSVRTVADIEITVRSAGFVSPASAIMAPARLRGRRGLHRLAAGMGGGPGEPAGRRAGLSGRRRPPARATLGTT